MKSLVCNVFGMAVGVACLALILNRPSVADEEKAAQEQKHVIVVKSDDGTTSQEQEHVIIVKAGDEKVDVAEALKKALHGKLDGMPADIQEKIKQKLKAVKELRDSKTALSARVLELKEGEDGKHIVVQVEPKDGADEASQTGQVIQLKTIMVGSDEEAGTVEQSASQQQQQTATVVAKAMGGGEEDHVAVAVAVDGQGGAENAQAKTITVTVKDGQVLINGKPVKIPALKAVKKGEVKVEVSADAKTGETKTSDGAIQYEVTIVGDDAKDTEGTHKMQWRAVNVKPGPGEPKVGVFTVAPGMPMTHALRFQAMPAAKAHADVVKRLKGIESELKQIRKLLEEMQQEDADD